MDSSLPQALVRNILEHAEDYPWLMQEIGLLGLRLDDRREYRLHVWDPYSGAGSPRSTTTPTTSPPPSSWAS